MANDVHATFPPDQNYRDNHDVARDNHDAPASLLTTKIQEIIMMLVSLGRLLIWRQHLMTGNLTFCFWKQLTGRGRPTLSLKWNILVLSDPIHRCFLCMMCTVFVLAWDGIHIFIPVISELPASSQLKSNHKSQNKFKNVTDTEDPWADKKWHENTTLLNPSYVFQGGSQFSLLFYYVTTGSPCLVIFRVVSCFRPLQHCCSCVTVFMKTAAMLREYKLVTDDTWPDTIASGWHG